MPIWSPGRHIPTQKIPKCPPPRDSATALTVSSVTGSKQAILPVILVEILGSENAKRQGNLLLDSGAQVSLIKLSVSDELGLKGKEVTITIAKVGGEEEELITKLFRVRI